MYRRILVAVDSTPTSERALIEAIRLARDQRARLRIIHVIGDPYAYFAVDGTPPETIVRVEQEWRHTGQTILHRAATMASQEGVQPETALLEEDERTSAAIVADARQWRADLLVLGTNGRHGLGELLLGSVAEEVLRDAAIPVLLLRGP